MSEYFTVEGQILYPSKSALDKALEVLIDGGWLKRNGKDVFWLNEGGFVTHSESCVSGLLLTIPRACYRNLNRTFNAITKEAASGEMVFFSTDGHYCIGRWSMGCWEQYSLCKDILRLSGDESDEARDLWVLSLEKWERKYAASYFRKLKLVLEAAVESMRIKNGRRCVA